MIKTAIKTIILTSLMTSMIYVGDKYKPFTNFKNEIKFYNVKASKDTPEDYLNWGTKIEVKDGMAELYFGNFKTDKFRRVHENGNVGSFGESIDEFIDKFKFKTNSYLEENSFYNNTKKEIKSTYEDLKWYLNKKFN